MNAWNNYMWPNHPADRQIHHNADARVKSAERLCVDYGMLMLGVLICTIPTAIVFFFFQKSFTEGITGAVK